MEMTMAMAIFPISKNSYTLAYFTLPREDWTIQKAKVKHIEQ